MERPLRGQVVVVPFPFSDLSRSKRRPAFVVTALPGRDLVLCQITSQGRGDPHAVVIEDRDFESGGLRRRSFVRPGRLFTAEETIVLYAAGTLRAAVVEQIMGTLIEVLTG